ncbi:DUF6701 domain-containing protein [Candidatus Pelagadaptatus aseana]|uniref:DUF6701 domain-containing protein n=1 Tax=Candidatus Pelagadaptatus aseana TaxID=3120508 RepID=UPI003C6F16AA
MMILRSTRQWLLLLLLVLPIGEALAGRTIVSVDLNGGAPLPVTVGSGGSVSVDITVSMGGPGNDNWRATQYSFSDGTSGCIDHSNYNSGTETETFNITAPTTAGTYNLELIAFQNNSCGGGSDVDVISNAVTVSGGAGSTAGCSSMIGDATINEVAQAIGGDPSFIEIKVLDTDLGVLIALLGWRLELCDSGGCESFSLLSSFGNSNPDLASNFPWMVFEGDEDFNDSRLDFKDGFSVALYDNSDFFGSNDKVIDVLSVNGFDVSGYDCSNFDYDTDYSGTNNGTKFVYRDPDGTGDWDKQQSNGQDETPGGDNDGSGGGGVEHYAISFTGGADFTNATGLTCQASEITIIAHDVNDNPIAPGVGVQINLSTSSGRGAWSSPDAGSLSSIGNNDGTAIYTFASNDTVRLLLNHTDAGVVNINTGSDSAGEDPNIEFFDSGFRFIDGSDNPLTIANGFIPVAAQNSDTFYLQAVRKDNNTLGCVGVFSNGSVHKIGLAAECIDPIACRGEQVSLINNGNNYTVATNDGAPGYTNDLDILFGVDSKAAFTLNYPDVGLIQLHARHDILLENGSDSGVDILGSSDSFVVRPADLVITSIPGNLGTEAIGTGFQAAGTDFTVQVEARNALGNRTPNFGREVSPESVSLTFDSLSYPSPGDNGSLFGGTFTLTTTDGLLEATDVNWSEVGTFTAYPVIADGNYLGAGDVTGATSGNIGRFYPDYFSLDTSALGDTCGSFSYLSQPGMDVSFTITANRFGGGQVNNYYNDTAPGFAVATVEQVAEQNNNGADLSARLSVSPANWVNGQYIVNDTSALLVRDAGLEAPLDGLSLGLKITDTLDSRDFDSLDMNAATSGDCTLVPDCDARALSGTLNLRFGRLFTKDVHGPESSPLPLILRAEYWNGSGWQLNSDDSCSSFPRANIDFAGTAIVNDSDLPVGVGSGTATGSFLNLSATVMTLVAGDAGLVFSAPGSGNTGSFPVAVDTSSMPWFQFDWDQDGSHDDDLPDATVSFGSYRGHDRVIYWQERLAD